MVESKHLKPKTFLRMPVMSSTFSSLYHIDTGFFVVVVYCKISPGLEVTPETLYIHF